MSSFLNKMKGRAGRHQDSDSDSEAESYSKPTQTRSYRYSLRSTSRSAACRGLYALRKSKYERRKNAARIEEDTTSEEEKDDDDDDEQVIKYSIYPQMVGKLRSQLEAEHARSTEGTRTARSVCRQRYNRHERVPSVDYDSPLQPEGEDSEYPDDRPIRVSTYPQAKYIKDPVRKDSAVSCTGSGFSCDSDPARSVPPYNVKHDSLPGDEYQVLVRRQKMANARHALEEYFAQVGSEGRYTCIHHGDVRQFTIPFIERRRLSMLQFAVRKNLRAGLDLLTDEFAHAMRQRADNVHFSEMSDVDGRPVEVRDMYAFIRAYQNAQDAAYKPKFGPQEDPKKRTWIDDRIARQTAAARAEGIAERNKAMEAEALKATMQPRLVSKFSWDDHDRDAKLRKRLTKIKL